MPGGEGIHVVPREGKWGLDGMGVPERTYDTQSDAIQAGRDIAKQQQTELLVHDEDGQISRRDSYGNDRGSNG
ncbi:MAG: DUF2188 domain-containing protein [Actinomycetota bacterium]|nr:DUF2188 domain-containing protein [Actinomycetota bacterium]